MTQEYNLYTPEHQQVWQILFDRQVANLEDKACLVFLEKLEALKPVLNSYSIVRFDLLNELLLQQTSWQIHVVPGIIPAADFLSFLAERKFCSSTWLRTMDQLDYLEEPDMFHDIFGHIPLLMDAEYASFMQGLGQLGVQYADNPDAIAMLERFYWFTIEFGLLNDQDATRIYGAGIISSFGESKSIFSESVSIRPFALNQILQHGFVKSDMQNEYFQISSLAQLYRSLGEVAQLLVDTQ